jgi:hypothetical protein
MAAVIAIALALAAVGCGPMRAESTPVARPAVYTGFGGGHLLRAVYDAGRYVALEDGSRWEIAPDDRFQSAEWQPDASMTVSAGHGEHGFDNALLNTTTDVSVMAKFIPSH